MTSFAHFVGALVIKARTMVWSCRTSWVVLRGMRTPRFACSVARSSINGFGTIPFAGLMPFVAGMALATCGLGTTPLDSTVIFLEQVTFCWVIQTPS
jgi:hypothetical protein